MKNAIAAAVVICLAVITAGCNSHAYHREALQYHAIARDVLIAKHVCSDDQDCQKKHLLFAQGPDFSLGFVHWGGAYITLYETKDSLLVEEIAAKFRQLHESLKEPQVKLTVYSSKHLESEVKFREVVIQ